MERDREGESRRRGGEGRSIDMLHDELIEEILLRVRCSATLLGLPAVCKRWRSITGGATFRHFHQLRSAGLSLLGYTASPDNGTETVACFKGRQRRFRQTPFPKAPDRRSTPSCHGLVCLFRVMRDTREITVWNPTTGESLVLPPSPLDVRDGRQSSVFFGFHPLTNKYKALVMCYRRFHVLTVGSGGSWRTTAPERDRAIWLTQLLSPYWRSESFPISFCYNGVLYWFLEGVYGSRTGGQPALLGTCDLGSEELDVHHGSSCRRDVGSHPMPADHQKYLQTEGIKHSIECVIRLGDFGQTVDVWWTPQSSDPDYEIVSFKIGQDRRRGTGATTATGSAVLPICIRMGSTLVCDDEGLRFYRDLMVNVIEYDYNRYLRRSYPLSLHEGTRAPLKDLI